ncbi:MAG: TlpA family protein disulfide reductase [Bacteroidales bacterium]|jgi:thiol-disulfide isomerase/thioredoxin|nr:TlpA family protein disulfide reductase [Bacteroidales bacterium]
MKKIVFLLLCVWSICGCGEKRPAVIEHPVFDVWNNATLEINKIEMTDSATVFYFDAFLNPDNWIRIGRETCIRESGTDEKLPVTGSEGITLDEDFYMPASGKASFKLFFPPLPPKAVKIDFMANNCPDCFQIWGIRLLPGAKVTFDPLPENATESGVQPPLPPSVAGTEKTLLSGRFLGYIEGMDVNVDVLADELFIQKQSIVELPVAGDGSFSGEIPVRIPGIVNTSAGNIFLVPGKSQEIYIDLKKKSRYMSRYRTDREAGDSLYIRTSGEYMNQSELNALMKKTQELFDFDTLANEVADMPPDAYREYLLGILRRELERIPETGMSANARILLACSMKFRALVLLLQYEAVLGYVHAGNSGEKNAKPEWKPEKPGMAYYSFLSETMDQHLSYLPNYSFLAGVLRNIDVFRPSAEQSVKEKIRYFRERISPLLGYDNGLLFDVVHGQFYADRLQQMSFFTDADKKEIRAAFRHQPAIADVLIAENDSMRKQLAVLKDSRESVVHETPKVGESKMLDAILSAYRGKVVVVDFWATWCGPCIAAHQSILPLKKEMEGKDVVFLYLTGETSPVADWNKMIPDIHGEHYRVSDAQWNYWGRTIPIRGVPSYMIYGREGRQVFQSTGFPGVEILKTEIEKQL